MCGRFTLATTPADLLKLFGAAPGFSLKPRYNIAPSQDILGYFFQSETAQNDFAWFRWGLIPSWAKDEKIGNRMINARSETVAEKPAFRAAFAKRRCLIPFSGFYEWQAGPDGKTPFCIHRPQTELFAVAGIWESWGKENPIRSASLLTTTANAQVQPIHDRMPVIIAAEHFKTWLDGETPPQKLKALLGPAPEGLLQAFAVSRRVNNPRFDDAQCLSLADGTRPRLL